MRHLPYFCRGEVVKGFGRGSKELGIPTANFSEQVVESFPSDIPTGIYYGWACVGNGDVHKMVVSIGWNPFYKNIKKSVETHIIHTFKEDFYGEILSIVITGYIRPEKNFDSLDALISAIQEDIEEAKRQLDLPEHLKLKEDNFFHLPEGKIGDLEVIYCTGNKMSDFKVGIIVRHRKISSTLCTKCRSVVPSKRKAKSAGRKEHISQDDSNFILEKNYAGLSYPDILPQHKLKID